MGVDISQWSSTNQYVFCTFGVMFFLMAYGLLQEQLVMKTFNRTLGWFVTLLQLCGYAFCAWLQSVLLGNRIERRIPYRQYVILGALQVKYYYCIDFKRLLPLSSPLLFSLLYAFYARTITIVCNGFLSNDQVLMQGFTNLSMHCKYFCFTSIVIVSRIDANSHASLFFLRSSLSSLSSLFSPLLLNFQTLITQQRCCLSPREY